VPVGLDGRGLPVGLQLAALPEQEAALVGLGIALDEDVQLFRRSPKGTAPPVAPPPR
jgi:aspartyl-tRNA(Asn)/glutamyl-tRNA(Gln) amidotransferase subunit A